MVLTGNIIGFFHSFQPTTQIFTAFKTPVLPSISHLLVHSLFSSTLKTKQNKKGVQVWILSHRDPICPCCPICIRLKLPVSGEEADPSIFSLLTSSAFPGILFLQPPPPPVVFRLSKTLFAGSSLPPYGLLHILVTQLYHRCWSRVCVWFPPSFSFLSRVSWQEHSYWGIFSLPSLSSTAIIWVPVLHSNSLRKLQIPIFSPAKYAFILTQMSHLTWKQSPTFIIWFKNDMGKGVQI